MWKSIDPIGAGESDLFYESLRLIQQDFRLNFANCKEYCELSANCLSVFSVHQARGL